MYICTRTHAWVDLRSAIANETSLKNVTVLLLKLEYVSVDLFFHASNVALPECSSSVYHPAFAVQIGQISRTCLILGARRRNVAWACTWKTVDVFAQKRKEGSKLRPLHQPPFHLSQTNRVHLNPSGRLEFGQFYAAWQWIVILELTHFRHFCRLRICWGSMSVTGTSGIHRRGKKACALAPSAAFFNHSCDGAFGSSWAKPDGWCWPRPHDISCNRMHHERHRINKVICWSWGPCEPPIMLIMRSVNHLLCWSWGLWTTDWLDSIALAPDANGNCRNLTLCKQFAKSTLHLIFLSKMTQ